MIIKSEMYHFHRLDLTRQAGFIVTIYDEDGLRLGATAAFEEARKIVDNKIEGHLIEPVAPDDWRAADAKISHRRPGMSA
jgi:hypothetical protein